MHEALEIAVEGAQKRELHWLPPSGSVPVGALYARAIIAEDTFVNALLKGGRPLFASTFDNKVDVSDCMPIPGPIWDEFEWPEYSWHEWARRVRVSLPMVRKYRRAVYEATDSYLKSLAPADLARPVDLSRMGYGEVTIAWVISRMLMARMYEASAEIHRARDLYGEI